MECVLVASGSTPAAARAARQAGLEPRLVLTKSDCAGRLGPARRQARGLGLQTVAIHTRDWDRQPLPALFELAAVRLGLPDTRVLIGDGAQVQLSRSGLILRSAGLPLDVATALSLVGMESARLSLTRRRRHAVARVDSEGDAVLAIWPGASGTNVGGAVTHMSGVLAALRRLGLRIGLLTMGRPPPQLEEIAHDIEVASPLPRAHRLTGEVAGVCTNRVARAAGRRLLRRIRPRLVYQRHEAFVTYGAELAGLAGAPLVLEWNNSEAWALLHWHVSSPLKRAFYPLAREMESYVLQRAALVASVSSHSAEMALEEGAPPERVVVLPNGVDIEAIDRARASVSPSAGDGAVVGWVGSFDPWHGADVLVRALADLPSDVRGMLVGDGSERAHCQSLARELGIDERVEWTGTLPHARAVQRLAECHVLVSPHVPMDDQPFFGSPTKIFEYMAIGRPIVASALEQIGEILDDGLTARLVKPGDAHDLARAIADILRLPDRGEQLGLAARREAEGSHTWDARVRVILETLSPND